MTNAVLYDYWRSSASYRVRIALNLAGIAYDVCAIDLMAADHKKITHLARNPQGLVPVLDIDGARLTQSLAILDYLDTTRDLGLIPRDPIAAARMRGLAMVLAVDVHPVCNVSVASFAARLSDDEDGTRAEWMHRFIAPGLAAFEAMLPEADGPFCCGPAPTLADLCLIPQLYNARRWSVAYDHLPGISHADAACAALPAFQAATPDAVRP